MGMKYDRSTIMLHAHALRKEAGMSMSDAMKQAWQEARAPKAVAVAPMLILSPMAQAAMGAVALVRKLRGARIDVAMRVRVDAGLRVTPKGEAPIAFAKKGEIGVTIG